MSLASQTLSDFKLLNELSLQYFTASYKMPVGATLELVSRKAVQDLSWSGISVITHSTGTEHLGGTQHYAGAPGHRRYQLRPTIFNGRKPSRGRMFIFYLSVCEAE